MRKICCKCHLKVHCTCLLRDVPLVFWLSRTPSVSVFLCNALVGHDVLFQVFVDLPSVRMKSFAPLALVKGEHQTFCSAVIRYWNINESENPLLSHWMLVFVSRRLVVRTVSSDDAGSKRFGVATKLAEAEGIISLPKPRLTVMLQPTK